ncbi:ABC transporter permease [Nocardiopsis halotolerans]|uniref:ABC transporter permease n=1 Tax=Nocardiopsis halotolerans TaxID=124252 RepID=UPI0003497621|nr:ABC-2 family transporter protein [Nocardiopsis halotolerans]
MNPLRPAFRYTPFVTGSLQSLLRYRSMFAISAVTAAASAAMMIFLWRAVHSSSPDGPPGGFDTAELTTYLLVAQILGLLHANRVDDEVSAEVYRGHVAAMLLKPVSYPAVRAFACLPVIGTNALFAGLPVLLLFALLVPLNVPRPVDALLFAVSAVLSAAVAYLVNLLVGMAAFVTTNTWGIRLMKQTVVAFFSGQMVPVGLMPDALAAVTRLLPFHTMVDSPLTLLLGRYDGVPGILGVLGLQLLWTAVMCAVAALVWRFAVRRLEVLGG